MSPATIIIITTGTDMSTALIPAPLLGTTVHDSSATTMAAAIRTIIGRDMPLALSVATAMVTMTSV